MSNIVGTFAPNRKVVQDSQNSTSWLVLATDGTAYATIALLLAAGKTPAPGFDPGLYAQSMTVKCVATGGVTDGSPCYVAWNLASAPSDDTTAQEISGSGQTFTFPGGTYNNIWARKTVSSDILIFDWLY